ncbi:uncharacterized protein EV420DRAFT_1641022 [Desarmillaria tabescens]|uniref:Uncharacterized protein n=1 Tax=Armillaria tabescens TaxID=1929756 RepID=A0AA39N7J4_ARMTA|nr:uncharacterized protein EV420DRAFT_1641022 [Desarmillaria tabescens]KAK0460478.1 hypothetical protein EV420DRAFT_1641022 [Desarmillaria tabescens]
MISDQDFLRSIPPPKLRFLVAAMLHKRSRSALKFPCKDSELLIEKVWHLCIDWRALAHPARYKMDQVMLALADFLQKYPSYRPWGQLSISPESSLSSLATTPPQSEQELSQPLNPSPTSQPVLTPPQPVIITPPKKLFAIKKSYAIIGLVPTPQASSGPIRVCFYKPKCFGRRPPIRRPDTMDGAGPSASQHDHIPKVLSLPDMACLSRRNSLLPSLGRYNNSTSRCRRQSLDDLSAIKTPCSHDYPDILEVAGPIEPLSPVQELASLAVEPIIPMPMLMETDIPMVVTEEPFNHPDDMLATYQIDALPGSSPCSQGIMPPPSEEGPFLPQDLLAEPHTQPDSIMDFDAILQEWESKPFALDSPFLLPDFNLAGGDFIHDAPGHRPPESGQVQMVEPSSTSTSCQPSADVEAHTAQSKPAAITHDKTSPDTAPPLFIDLHQYLYKLHRQLVSTSSKAREPIQKPMVPTPSIQSVTTMPLDFTPPVLTPTTPLIDEIPLEDPDGGSDETSATQTSGLEEGFSDDQMSESSEEDSSCTETSLSDQQEETDSDESDSSESDDELQRYQSNAEPASDSVISVVVSRSTQEGIQALAMPIFPRGIKILHGQTYIRLQQVLDFVALAKWSIPAPLSDEEFVAIHLTTASLSHPHNRLIAWGWANLDDATFNLEACSHPDGSLPVWVPVQRIYETAGYQLSLCFKIFSRRWLEKQRVRRDHAKIAFIGPEMYDSGWFILPLQQTDAELRVVPPHSITKSKFHDIQSDEITHHKLNLSPDWCIENGICYLSGLWVLRGLSSVVPPSDDTHQLGVFLPGVNGRKLYLGCIDSKGCRLPQYAWKNVDVPVNETDEGPCVACFIVKGRPTALLKYDIGLTQTISSHFQKITEDLPAWVISPHLVASLNSQPLRTSCIHLCQLLDQVYNKNHIFEAWLCWIQDNKIVSYCIPVLPSHWTFLGGHFYVSMHHIISWTSHSSALKLPTPLTDHPVMMTALKVDKNRQEFVFIGMGTFDDDQILRFEPPPRFRKNSTVWLPLDDDEQHSLLYMQFQCKPLSEFENLRPREYFPWDAISQSETTQYYMSPAVRNPQINWENDNPMRAHISITIHVQKQSQTAVFRAWTAHAGLVYISTVTVLRRLLEMLAVARLGSAVRVDLQTPDLQLYIGHLYPEQNELVTPKGVHKIPSDQKPFASVPITMTEVGIGNLRCEVVCCCDKEIKGKELIGVDQSHFKLMHAEESSIWYIPKSCLSSVPLTRGQKRVNGAAPLPDTQVQPNSALEQGNDRRPGKVGERPQPSSVDQNSHMNSLEKKKGVAPAKKLPKLSKDAMCAVEPSIACSSADRSGGKPVTNPSKGQKRCQHLTADGDRPRKKVKPEDSVRAAKVAEALHDSCYKERHELQAIWDRPDKQALPLQDTLMLGKDMWDLLKHTYVGQVSGADLMPKEDHDIQIIVDDWMSFFNAGRSWLTAMKYIGQHMHGRSVDNVLVRLKVECSFPKRTKPGKRGKKPKAHSTNEVKRQLDRLFGELTVRHGLKLGDTDFPLCYSKQPEGLE